jgi:hypothetical protein
MSLFLLFPFTRLVHIWSFPIGYLTRSYQIVRTKRRIAQYASAEPDMLSPSRVAACRRLSHRIAMADPSNRKTLNMARKARQYVT